MAQPSRETARGVSLPPQQAIAFFLGKTNTTTEHWTDVWQEAHSRSFMVAGAATEALVGDFRQAVAQAIEAGTTLADFRAQFDEIVGRHGWDYKGGRNWRSRIIYETNLSTAYSAGRYAQMTDPETLEAFPYWRYVHSGAAHPRLQHKAWNGLTLRADDGFWKTHYPPNGWRCGCRVEPMSARDLARGGRFQVDEAPDVVTRPWTNPKTGRSQQVPEGIDPGFAYSPGAAWKGSPPVPPGADLRPPPGWPPAPPMMPRGEGNAVRAPGAVRAAPGTAPPAEPSGVSEADFERLLRQAERRRLDRDTARGGTRAAEFGGWMDGLLARDLRSDGTRQVLGSLPEAARAGLPDGFADPVQLTSARAAHMARDSKAAGGRGLGLDLLRRLPELMEAPRAVLIEERTGDVIVVLREGREDQVAKVVVRAGYSDARRGVREVFPAVVTAGWTPRDALRQRGRYRLVDGEL